MILSRFVGACCRCQTPLRVEIADTEPAEQGWRQWGVLRPCANPLCDQHVRVMPVCGREGRQTCGARCRNARGPDCECSCVGANHGAGL